MQPTDKYIVMIEGFGGDMEFKGLKCAENFVRRVAHGRATLIKFPRNKD